MAEVDNGMDTMQANTNDGNLLDSDVPYPVKRETDPMSQSMYDASTSDPMTQSMYGYDNGLPDAAPVLTEIPNAFDSLCSNGDAQYLGSKDQGSVDGMQNGSGPDEGPDEGPDAGPVPEGVLIDFGGQIQKPIDPAPMPEPSPVIQSKPPEPQLMSQEPGMSQSSEQTAQRPDMLGDLIATEPAPVSQDKQPNEGKSFGEVSAAQQTQATTDSSVSHNMDGGGDLMSEGETVKGGTLQGGKAGDSQPVNGDVQQSMEYTSTTRSVTESNGEVATVTRTEETTMVSRIPQKPPSPKKSGVPVLRSPKKEAAVDVGPGWDDSITVTHPRPRPAHLLPRNMKEPTPPPRPQSGRQSVERKKYGIDSKRPDYRPGGGDIQIFSEKKEYRAEARIDARASPASRASPKPGTPRTTPVKSPSPNLSGVRSKIGSMEKAKHTPGGGNVRIVTKKTDYTTVSSRVGSKDKLQHKPGGGNVKIENKKLTLDNVTPRIGSLDNARHQAGGGDKKIVNEKVEFKAEPKVGSLKNVKHSPGGGEKVIETQKLNFKETAKARTKHGMNDDSSSRRSNSVTSQSTTDGSQ